MKVTLSQYAGLGDSRYQVDDKVIIEGDCGSHFGAVPASVTVRQTNDLNDDLVLAIDIADSDVTIEAHGDGLRLLVRKR